MNLYSPYTVYSKKNKDFVPEVLLYSGKIKKICFIKKKRKKRKDSFNRELFQVHC